MQPAMGRSSAQACAGEEEGGWRIRFKKVQQKHCSHSGTTHGLGKLFYKRSHCPGHSECTCARGPEGNLVGRSKSNVPNGICHGPCTRKQRQNTSSCIVDAVSHFAAKSHRHQGMGADEQCGNLSGGDTEARAVRKQAVPTSLTSCTTRAPRATQRRLTWCASPLHWPSRA